MTFEILSNSKGKLGVDFTSAWDYNNNLIIEEKPSWNDTTGSHGRGFKQIVCQCVFNPDLYILNNYNLHCLAGHTLIV